MRARWLAASRRGAALTCCWRAPGSSWEICLLWLVRAVGCQLSAAKVHRPLDRVALPAAVGHALDGNGAETGAHSTAAQCSGLAGRLNHGLAGRKETLRGQHAAAAVPDFFFYFLAHRSASVTAAKRSVGVRCNGRALPYNCLECTTLC